jgi:hypothetical protein
MGTNYICNKANQHCTKETGDPNPYCKMCTTDDCNDEGEQEPRNSPKKSESIENFWNAFKQMIF